MTKTNLAFFGQDSLKRQTQQTSGEVVRLARDIHEVVSGFILSMQESHVPSPASLNL